MANKKSKGDSKMNELKAKAKELLKANGSVTLYNAYGEHKTVYDMVFLNTCFCIEEEITEVKES